MTALECQGVCKLFAVAVAIAVAAALVAVAAVWLVVEWVIQSQE